MISHITYIIVSRPAASGRHVVPAERDVENSNARRSSNNDIMETIVKKRT